jgi:Protein of unknown function (DUF4231)
MTATPPGDLSDDILGPPSGDPADDPLKYLDEKYAWYRSHAVRARQRYQVLEVTVLVFAAMVPVSAVVTEPWVTALLGGVVVVLTGLRSIFSWQEDWLRFTEAWQQLQFARTLYVNRLPPYDDDATRVSRIVVRVQEVQAAETRGWLALRAADKRRDVEAPPRS